MLTKKQIAQLKSTEKRLLSTARAVAKDVKVCLDSLNQAAVKDLSKFDQDFQAKQLRVKENLERGSRKTNTDPV